MIDKKLILASKSPRRKDLLTQLAYPFSIELIDVDESYDSSMNPLEVPEFLAKKKAAGFTNIEKDTVVITADTIVLCENKILEKPKNEVEAKKMLETLSDTMHLVLTGVSLKSSDRQVYFTSTSEVYFHKLLAEEIDFYIKNYSPYDKAGGYGIQEWIGLIAIKKINGSYTNIVGLPMERLYQELKAF